MYTLYKGNSKKDDIEMRKVYSTKLLEIMNIHDRVVALEADLMSAMTVDIVKNEKPNKVINCGIMEANMIGVAAGMSIAGKYPFVHTFAPFASRRCYDQLFMSISYQKNNVKVIDSIVDFSYTLDERDTKLMKDNYQELKNILKEIEIL